MSQSRSSDTKTIEIVAGPNGSGKSTFAESYLLRIKKNLVFLNPDLIASGIAPLDFERASFHAGRVLIGEVKARLNRNENFAFESTLSGRTWANILSEANQKGYAITIHFLYLKSVKINIERIKSRVQQGGHNISTEAVLRRQPRCFQNFWHLYRPLANDWYVFDNSGSKPRLILSRAGFEAMTTEKQFLFSADFEKGRPNGTKTK